MSAPGAAAILAAAAALASALAAWRSSLVASRAIEPALSIMEAPLDGVADGPDFYIENVGGGVAIATTWYLLVGGESFYGSPGPNGTLRPNQRGYVRPILKHPTEQPRGVVACRDADGQIFVWSYGGERRRIKPPRWYAPWRGKADPSILDVFDAFYGSSQREGVTDAPWQWVPEGGTPKTSTEVMGFGQP